MIKRKKKEPKFPRQQWLNPEQALIKMNFKKQQINSSSVKIKICSIIFKKKGK